jgi:hypothetical protein
LSPSNKIYALTKKALRSSANTIGRVANFNERKIADALIEEQIGSGQWQVTTVLWLGGSRSTLDTGRSSLPLSDEFRRLRAMSLAGGLSDGFRQE